jgi:hypothetical protein
MASVDSPNRGAPPGQAGGSGGPQELLKDIKDTKGELDDVKKKLTELEPLVEANHNFKDHGRYSNHEEAKAALLRLEAKEARLQDLLTELQRERNMLLQKQQQQSGAGV